LKNFRKELAKVEEDMDVGSTAGALRERSD